MLSHYPLTKALLFGQTNFLDEKILFLCSRTGLMHIFSVSGFHMGAALGIAHIVIKILPIRTPQARAWFQCIFSLGLMLFFGFQTEWSSPMVRALVFASIRSFALALRIREDKQKVFLISLICAALFGRGSELSLLLSALGMVGILFLYPGKWWSPLICPCLTTAPVIIWQFGILSLSAPLWNLTVGTLLSWSCLPLSILGLFCQSLQIKHPFFAYSEHIANFCFQVLEMGDHWLGGSFWVQRDLWLTGTLLLLVAYFLPKRAAHFVLIGLLFLPLVNRPFSLAVLDVGQGDSIYLHTKQASTLVDTGPAGKYTPVSRAITRLGISRLDHILLTHPDLDHRGGLPAILARYPVQYLWLRKESLREKGGMLPVAQAEQYSIPIRFINEQNAPPGLQCWLPPYKKKNDLSPLCLAQLSQKTILLTGDLSQKAEAYFLESLHPFPVADILKVAHHGSKTSSSSKFLQKVHAKMAYISVGKKNRYGHPAPETITRLQQAGLQIFRTDQNGSLFLRFF